MIDKPKTKWEKVILGIIFIELIFTIYCLIFAIDLFWTGFHNVDICHNEAMISEINDLDISEITLAGNFWDLQSCYLHGLKQIRWGLFGSIIFSISLGISLGYLFILASKEDK